MVPEIEQEFRGKECLINSWPQDTNYVLSIKWVSVSWKVLSEGCIFITIIKKHLNYICKDSVTKSHLWWLNWWADISAFGAASLSLEAHWSVAGYWLVSQAHGQILGVRGLQF